MITFGRQKQSEYYNVNTSANYEKSYLIRIAYFLYIL